MLESPRIVDILHLRLHLVSKSYVRYPTGSSHPRTDSCDAALKDIADKVAQRGAKLFVIGPNPLLAKQEMMALKPKWFNSLNRAKSIPPKNSDGHSLYSDNHHLSPCGQDLLFSALVNLVKHSP